MRLKLNTADINNKFFFSGEIFINYSSHSIIFDIMSASLGKIEVLSIQLRRY